MLEGTERLLAVSHGLTVDRARHGLLSRLPTVCQGLVPHFTPQGVVRQPFDLIGPPVPSESFHNLDNTGMQRPPPLLEEATIGHIVRQGVLESVFQLGEEARLIQKLCSLEVSEVAVQVDVR